MFKKEIPSKAEVSPNQQLANDTRIKHVKDILAEGGQYKGATEDGSSIYQMPDNSITILPINIQPK